MLDDLLANMQKVGKDIDLARLDRIVKNDNKKRYSFSEDGKKIRANQGHSIKVDLNLKPVPPPDLLYHGTAAKNISSIKLHGLQKQSRQHLHLSHDRETAIKVGRRHGKPMVLLIKSGEMQRAGATFYLSKNGVWLTDEVKPEFIEFP